MPASRPGRRRCVDNGCESSAPRPCSEETACNRSEMTGGACSSQGSDKAEAENKLAATRRRAPYAIGRRPSFLPHYPRPPRDACCRLRERTPAFDPRDRACAILDSRRKLVLGSEPIVDRYDSAASRVRELATYGVVRDSVADAEATPVHEYDRGQRSAAAVLSTIEAQWDIVAWPLRDEIADMCNRRRLRPQALARHAVNFARLPRRQGGHRRTSAHPEKLEDAFSVWIETHHALHGVSRGSCGRRNPFRSALPLQTRDEVAAIHRQDGTRHVRTRIRAHQQQRTFQLARLPEPPLRDSLDQDLAGFAREELPIEVRLDVSGAQGVYADTMASEFERHRLGQLHDGSL